MEHDVFISHASEDKDAFVKELASTLRAKGLSVWYDNFTLRLGDSLSASIGKGLASSTFGVVVISPHFIAKRWPQRELAVLIAREDYAEKVILPVWHHVTKRDILEHLPLLADKLAANSDDGIEAVARQILEVVSPGRIAEAKFQQGLDFERNGDRDAARATYIDVLRIDPNHALALSRFEGLLSSRRPSLHNVEILLGQVTFYSAAKGFGFVKAQSGEEHFLHVSVLETHQLHSLAKDDRVAFLLGELRGRHRVVVSVKQIVS